MIIKLINCVTTVSVFLPTIVFLALRYINTLNRQHLGFKLHVNHFADTTEKEMDHYKGLLNESYQDNQARQFKPPEIDLAITPIPDTLDWREYG